MQYLFVHKTCYSISCPLSLTLFAHPKLEVDRLEKDSSSFILRCVKGICFFLLSICIIFVLVSISLNGFGSCQRNKAYFFRVWRGANCLKIEKAVKTSLHISDLIFWLPFIQNISISNFYVGVERSNFFECV